VGTVSLKSEAASRSVRMLRTAMGRTITGWLEDPAIVEIMLNPAGRLWIDRLTGASGDAWKRLSAEDGDRASSRPLKREIGRELFGVIRGNDISWQLGAFEGSALECNYTDRVASQRAPAQTRRVNTRMTCCTIYRCPSIFIEGGHAVGASYSGDRTSHSLPGLMWPQLQSRQRK
jgi:hypothetical protein